MTGPLDGVKVVDLSNMLMAPYATQILGDMGADVIKVEAPAGDPIRGRPGRIRARRRRCLPKPQHRQTL